MNVINLISDKNLLGPFFAGASWATWKIALRAAYGLQLNQAEREVFRQIAGDRDPPTKRVRELLAVVGRRGGKDSAASAIATERALADYSAILRPGELGTILCLACDRVQSKIILGYVKAYFREVPMLAGLVKAERDDGLLLNTGIEIIVGTNDF